MPRVREDLRPGTRKADKIKELVRKRIDMSYDVMSQAHKYWDIAEEHYRAFRSVDDADLESYRVNGVVKIIIPIQFATIQTMVTFLMEVFTAMKPVLRVRGADPASVRPARVMEVLLDYDYRSNRGYFKLYNWFINACRYGFGVMANTWGTKQILRRQLIQAPDQGKIRLDGQEFSIPGALEYKNDWFTTFEGNTWDIVDPRTFFPDPRVPLARFQDGEFCGRRTFIHDKELVRLEAEDLFFNTSYIQSNTSGPISSLRGSDLFTADSRRDRITPNQALGSDLQYAKKNRMHVNEELLSYVIPKDYNLSEETRPELWIFNLINGETIVRAEPAPPGFVEFPYHLIEIYPDELTFLNQGVMDLTEPMAAHLNFLFNSHMANVRKAIHDVLITDPSRVNLDDLLDPNGARIVRLLPAAYGSDVGAVVQQLQVIDVTKGHIQDSQYIFDIYMRILGTSDSMFGQISNSRRTASELQGVMRSAASRMKMSADLMSSQGVAPLTQAMAIMRQENMSTAQFVELAGQTATDLGVHPEDIINNFLKARRQHISGVFNFPAEEGVLPGDRAKAADILKEVFKAVSQSPFLQAVFDPVEIFQEVIRQSGYHSIDDFKRIPRADVRIMPVEQVMELAARGRARPLGRPDEGVRDSREGLGVEGFYGGAGRVQTPQ